MMFGLLAKEAASVVYSSVSNMTRTREHKQFLMRVPPGVGFEVLSLTWFLTDTSLQSMQIDRQLLRHIRNEVNEQWRFDLLPRHEEAFERLLRAGIADYEKITNSPPSRCAQIAAAFCARCEIEDEELREYVENWCTMVTEAVRRGLQRLGLDDRSHHIGIAGSPSEDSEDGAGSFHEIAERTADIGEN